MGFNLNGTEYFYVKNVQGDIEEILDTNGNSVVIYAYNAWGKTLSVTGPLADTVGIINPIRYRGYYLDSETGYYYLQSRYYNPDICRFINADEPDMVLTSTNEAFATNLFVYCNNNPTCNFDQNGEWYYSLNDFSYKNFVKRRINRKIGHTAMIYRNYSSQYYYNRNKLGYFNDYIYNQYNRRVAYLKFSSDIIKKVGCETIAIYNLMKFIGKYQYYPDVINECYMNGLDWFGGHLGINPKTIYKYFDAHYVSYKKSTYFTAWLSNLHRRKKGILAFKTWDRRISEYHTVMVVYKSNKYYVYNAYNYEEKRGYEETKPIPFRNKAELIKYMVGSFVIGYTF